MGITSEQFAELVKRKPGLLQGRPAVATHAPVGGGCGADRQPVLRSQPVEAPKFEAPHSGVCVVRITSFRRRLVDEDGLVGKFHLDAAVKNSGCVHDDSPQYVRYFVRQKKVKSQPEEGTLIEVIPVTKEQDEHLVKTIDKLIDDLLQ